VIILDSLVIGGLKFVLGKIAQAVDAEMNDVDVLREELLAAQMRLELGEVSEDEFAALERDILGRIREIREALAEAAETDGDLTVTGVEAAVWGDEDSREDDASR
jgi:hypothetical protein